MLIHFSGEKKDMKTITLYDKKIILIIGLLISTFIGYAQSPETFNTNGTFIVPAGVTTVQVDAWGGGGGGDSRAGSRPGGAGGGGAFTRKNSLAVTHGTNIGVTVGIGGTGAGAILGIGQNGGQTIFSTITLNI